MLKIRDDVDLKELERFGFIKIGNIYYYKNIFDVTILMIFDNKKISNPRDDHGNVILYDLIQAGLVEKESLDEWLIFHPWIKENCIIFKNVEIKENNI